MKKIKNIGAGVRIHDTDVDDWKRGGEKVLEGLDDAVVVDASEIEQREEKRRTYLGIKEDGSGWAVATDGSANANGNANAAAAAATTTRHRRDAGDTTRMTTRRLLDEAVTGTTATMRTTRLPQRRGEDTTRMTKTTEIYRLLERVNGATATTTTRHRLDVRLPNTTTTSHRRDVQKETTRLTCRRRDGWERGRAVTMTIQMATAPTYQCAAVTSAA